MKFLKFIERITKPVMLVCLALLFMNAGLQIYLAVSEPSDGLYRIEKIQGNKIRVSIHSYDQLGVSQFEKCELAFRTKDFLGAEVGGYIEKYISNTDHKQSIKRYVPKEEGDKYLSKIQ